VREKF
jgi:hypothetical protein